MAKGSGKAKSAPEQICYMRCQVEPGMFRGEWLVYLKTIDPGDPRHEFRAQLLVDDREVRGVQGTPKRNAPAPALLGVTLVKREADFAWIVLPQPASPNSDNVLVRRQELMPEGET